jgi:hypothetical protein
MRDNSGVAWTFTHEKMSRLLHTHGIAKMRCLPSEYDFSNDDALDQKPNYATRAMRRRPEREKKNVEWLK